MNANKIALLKLFVDECKSNPSVINDPSLSFFKSYLKSLGARIPQNPKSSTYDESNDANSGTKMDSSKGSEPNDNEDTDNEDHIVESDIELDGDVVAPDDDPPQKMGDPSVQVTEESRDAAQFCKAKAMDAISEGSMLVAIEHLTEAIMLNPTSAILYATRAATFVKMNKPNAAIRDANAALQINPDSAKGYKSRGMAKAMLGQWEEAAKDLHLASKLDFDEEIGSVLKKVEPNACKLEEHRRKYERLRKGGGPKKSKYSRQSQSRETLVQNHLKPDPVSDLPEGNVFSVSSSQDLESKISLASNLSRLTILYFTATWCGPCRYMSPIYVSLAAKYPKVFFLKVDLDERRDVAACWSITSVPTFCFVRGGKEIDKVVGADKNGLERKITCYAGQY